MILKNRTPEALSDTAKRIHTLEEYLQLSVDDRNLLRPYLRQQLHMNSTAQKD